MADSPFLTELKAFADTIAEITGKRTELTTNDKTNLVKAINETKAAIASSISGALTGYVTATGLGSALSAYALSSSLANYVTTSALSALIGAAPSTLDTIAEIDAAINNDPNFATTVMTALSGKQPLNANLTALGGLTAIQAFMLGLIASADLAALQTSLGIKLVGTTAGTVAAGDDSRFGTGTGTASTDIRILPNKITDYPNNASWHVGVIPLKSGTYQPPWAELGCVDSAYAATCTILKSDNTTTLVTIGSVAGNVVGMAASSGFTLIADDTVIVTLQSNNRNVKAVLTSLRIYQ